MYTVSYTTAAIALLKKRYLFAASMLLSMGTVFGQDFTYSTETTLHTNLATNVYSAVDIFIQTTDLSGITFGWHNTEDNLDPGWDYSMCDYTACYTEIPATGVMVAISDDEMAGDIKGFVKITISPNDISGEGNIKFYVFDELDPTIGDTINFTFSHINTASVEENEIGLSIYPNPSEGIVSLNNLGNKNLDYSIQDLSGKIVATGLINAESLTTVDLTGLNKGIYVFTSITAEGFARNEKIIIQ
jgi:hypothetical protein